MDQLIQTIIIGISNGLIYALVALGYTLVYGIIELLNFAQGDLFMLGSMIAITLLLATGVEAGMPVPEIALIIVAVLAATMVITATLNFTIERIAYKPLRNAPKVAPLISAIGMSFVLQNIGLLWKGPSNQSMEDVIPNRNVLTEVFGLDTEIAITYKMLFVAAVTIPLLIALLYFIQRTRQGKAMRATAQDQATSGLMGINVDRTIAITFLIGGALAGAAGVVQILFNGTTVWNLGFRFGLNSFTSAVLGGIGNLTGAVLGALLLGLVNAFSDRYLAAQWTNAIVFGVLIAILVFRPTGLLGQQLADRA